MNWSNEVVECFKKHGFKVWTDKQGIQHATPVRSTKQDKEGNRKMKSCIICGEKSVFISHYRDKHTMNQIASALWLELNRKKEIEK